MDLRKLRYFVGVAEAGGFRRASEALFIAQPSLTKHIRELELELNAKVFERSHLGICLTPAGRRLLTECEAILKRIDGLQNVVSDYGRLLHGSVTIGAPPIIAAMLFGPLAERIQAEHPHLHLNCISEGSRLLELLETGGADIAILTQVDAKELGPGWTAEELVREQCFLIGRVGDVHPEHYYRLEDIIQLPLILTPWRNSRRRQIELLAGRAGVSLNIVAEAEAMGAVSFARQGTGFAVLPYSSANFMKSLGPLEIAPIDDAWSSRLLVRRADRTPSSAANVVGKHIFDLFQKMVRDGAFSYRANLQADDRQSHAPAALMA